MIVEIISWSISTNVWDRAGIKLATTGSAAGLATDCITGPGVSQMCSHSFNMHAQLSSGTRAFINVPILYVKAAKALPRWHLCRLLLAFAVPYEISNKISQALS